jgi:hypothetical protein
MQIDIFENMGFLQRKGIREIVKAGKKIADTGKLELFFNEMTTPYKSQCKENEDVVITLSIENVKKQKHVIISITAVDESLNIRVLKQFTVMELLNNIEKTM